MSMSFVAKAMEANQHFGEAEQWYLRACGEHEDRDHWVRLAQFYCGRRFWAGAYAAAMRGLQMTVRPAVYMSDPACWGSWPHHIAGTAAYYLGLKASCLEHYKRALDLDPTNEGIRRDQAAAIAAMGA